MHTVIARLLRLIRTGLDSFVAYRCSERPGQILSSRHRLRETTEAGNTHMWTRARSRTCERGAELKAATAPTQYSPNHAKHDRLGGTITPRKSGRRLSATSVRNDTRRRPRSGAATVGCHNSELSRVGPADSAGCSETA
ncbi:MAG: hypothetical protein J07HR59_01691 [Halorubrum sp. J07HR59]|nr:MAG: hypothetical protein J07HR59_01691 [Halorubrum sp. J07HR59]